MEFTGKVIAVLTGAVKENSKHVQYCIRTVVLEEMTDRYPRKIALEVYSDAEKNQWNGVQVEVGQLVKAYFDIDAREWTNSQTGEVRWFNTVSMYRREIQGIVQGETQNTKPAPAPSVPLPPASNAPIQAPTAGANDGGDLPF